MLIPVLIVSSLVHIYSIGYMSHDPRGRVRGKRVYGGKLSNSGELLKLKVPSVSRKTDGGWSNYSGMVKSLKMSENKMDNRGSKSAIVKNIVVKEQRVDGSWFIKPHLMNLRCTLQGFERNRDIKLGFNMQQRWSPCVKSPSKQFDLKKFSTYNSTIVNPGVWSGLIDGEGSFSIILTKNWELILLRWLNFLCYRDFKVLRSPTSSCSCFACVANQRNITLFQPRWENRLKFLRKTRSNQLIENNFSTCNHIELFLITLYLNYILSSSVSQNHTWLSLWCVSFAYVYCAGYNKNKERRGHWATMNRYIPNNRRKPLLSNKLSLRRYSTTRAIEVRDPLVNFYEWLSGLTDGEGSFYMKSTGSRTFSFRYQLCLHKDDLEMLEFIQKTLGIGRIFTYRSQAYFDVTKQKDIAIIVDIFSNYPLNTLKHLNFLDFKKAYELYVSNKERTSEFVTEINTLKKGMNANRSDFGTTESRKFRITPCWALGFVEGEGSFHILNKDYYPRFSIGQSTKDLALMEELKNFFNNLDRSSHNQKGVAYLSINNERDMISLAISQRDYITNVLIPFFDSLPWHSKKEMDFQDWKAILKIRNLGLHYTEKGLEVIKLILSQMNSNLLSSKSRSTPVIDRAFLQIEVEKLLMEGSNFEEKEDGRIFIKSLNRFLPPANIGVEIKDKDGLVLNTFASLSDCAKFLGVSRSTATTRLRKSEPLLVNGKSIYICIR